MSSSQIFSNEFVVRWDEIDRKLIIDYLDKGKHPFPVVEIGENTFDGISWAEASKFIGEFFTLLIPDLRKKYSIHFHPDGQSGQWDDI